MKDGIYGFTSAQTRFLSNFYPANIVYEGIRYPSSEHAYQAAKTLDQGVRKQIAIASTPGQAKRFGQKVPVRKDWDLVKRRIMKEILELKFNIPSLRDKLLETDVLYLEETNTWGDRYWGVCKGSGQNHLGHILMEIRNDLKNSS
jgi:ribA/ribD-fused uncharacterized protein